MSIDTHEGSDTSQAAARLLEMTARETDQWRADARREAAVIVAAARTEAADLVRAAHEEADRAREEVAQLQEMATVHRDQLRRHLTAMLDRVDAGPSELS